MTDQRKVRIAQVGVGHFGAARRGMLRATGLFDLVASYDLSEAAMQSALAQDGARPTASYEELLDVDGIEAMVISTGAKFHAEQAIAAMEKGLHVFVEKPLCSTPAEIDALLETQKRTGRIVQVGHTDHRHSPGCVRLKQTIDAGEFGTISHFEKVTGHHGGMSIKPGDWRGDPDKNPGGMLFQCGVHATHALMFYFGPIARVSAVMRYDVNLDTRTADAGLCLLEFASGLVGTLNAFHVSPYRHYFNIYGTKKNYYQESRFFDEGTTHTLQTFTVDNVKEPWVPVDMGAMGMKDEAPIREGGLYAFHDAIVTGGPSPYPTLLDGARAVAVIFAADESARTGRAVDIVLPEG